jgi:hypothetical protein
VGKLTSKLRRLERAVHATHDGQCPLCFGRNRQAFTPRFFIQPGNDAPVMDGVTSCYDDNGRCRRCGAAAKDIIVVVPGVGGVTPSPSSG